MKRKTLANRISLSDPTLYSNQESCHFKTQENRKRAMISKQPQLDSIPNFRKPIDQFAGDGDKKTRNAKRTQNSLEAKNESSPVECISIAF